MNSEPIAAPPAVTEEEMLGAIDAEMARLLRAIGRASGRITSLMPHDPEIQEEIDRIERLERSVSIQRAIRDRLVSARRAERKPGIPLFTSEEIAILSTPNGSWSKDRKLGILEAASAAYTEAENDLAEADAINAELRAAARRAEERVKELGFENAKMLHWACDASTVLDHATITRHDIGRVRTNVERIYKRLRALNPKDVNRG